MSVVTFSDHAAVSAPPTHDLTAVRAAIANAKAGPQGTALADAVVKAVNVGRSVQGNAEGHPAARGGHPALRRRPDGRSLHPAAGRRLGEADEDPRLDGRARHARRCRPAAAARAATPSASRSRCSPPSLQLIARSSGGRFYQGAASVDVKSTYAALGSRVGKQAQDRRGDRSGGGRRHRLHARGRAALRRCGSGGSRESAARRGRRRARGRRCARARRRRDERVSRHPVVHPRPRAVGRRARARHDAVPAHVPGRQERRRRPRRAGDLA